MRALIGGAALFAALMHPAVGSAATPKRKPAVRATASAVPAAPHIGFTIVSEGEGTSPGPEDVVLIAYIGRLADGSVFDQNGEAPLPVADVVPGFGQALRRMKRGGSYHVTIPPSLGYGHVAAGPVPANATLIFDILLFDFKSKAEIEALRQKEEPPAPSAPSAP